MTMPLELPDSMVALLVIRRIVSPSSSSSCSSPSLALSMAVVSSAIASGWGKLVRKVADVLGPSNPVRRRCRPWLELAVNVGALFERSRRR